MILTSNLTFMISIASVFCWITSGSANEQQSQCSGSHPRLQRHKGNHGDVCRTLGGNNKSFRCPIACYKTSGGRAPFCQTSRKNKSPCRVPVVPESCCPKVNLLMTQMKASEAATIALNAKVDLLITRISAVEESINVLGRRATNTDNSLGFLCQMADAYGDSAISPMDCCHEEYDDVAHGTDQDGNKVVCMARNIASVMFGNVGVGTCASTCGGF